MLRPAIKWVGSAVATALVVPFIQTPATKLAERAGFDLVLANRWDSVMSFLSDLAQSSWYIFVAGVAVGLAVGLWLDTLLKRREAKPAAVIESMQSGPPPYIKTELRLQFFGDLRVPHGVARENVAVWYAYHSPTAIIDIRDEDGNKLPVPDIPPGWAIFLTIDKAISYKQAIAEFSNSQAPIHVEVRYSDHRAIVVLVNGQIPEGVLTIRAVD
jgi:hypothetical protein